MHCWKYSLVVMFTGLHAGVHAQVRQSRNQHWHLTQNNLSINLVPISCSKLLCVDNVILDILVARHKFAGYYSTETGAKPQARVESTRKPVWRKIHDARCPPFIHTYCKNYIITSFGCCYLCICSIIYQQIVILGSVQNGEFNAQVGRKTIKCFKCWEHSALFIVHC